MHIKYLYTLFFTFVTFIALSSEKTFDFDGDKYVLKHKNKNDNEILNEYIFKNEDLKSWTKLISVRRFPKHDNPKLLAKNVTILLQAQNPNAKFSLIENKKSNEIILDFFTWTVNPKIIEFNVFRYQKTPNGVILFQFAARNYGELTEDFKNNTIKNRMYFVDKISKIKIPSIEE